MKYLFLIALLYTGNCFGWDPTRTALHLVGDSTMSDKVNLAHPERGWGQLLPYFMDKELNIINHAANGRSTKRFIDEGRWQLVLSELNQGDYVLIQFGHNDQKKSDPARYADVAKAYPEYLRQYIADIKNKGAIPMLASSICRRHFTPEGKLKRTLTEYAQAAQAVAQEQEIDFIDLNRLSCTFLEQIGEAQSHQYFIKVPPDLYTRWPEGKIDNTHLNVAGAAKIAQMFVRELKRKEHPLSEYVYRDLL